MAFEDAVAREREPSKANAAFAPPGAFQDAAATFRMFDAKLQTGPPLPPPAPLH
jgi:hypothetical protein